MAGRRLLAVLAHPDDESFAIGGTIARYASGGVSVHLVTATSGQSGRWFHGEDRPDDDEVGRVREKELRDAADVLGIREVHLLGYRDGALDRLEPREAVAKIADHIRRIRPQVVVTFDPFGVYGHPDHVAICRLTNAAVVEAAGAPMPHRIERLFYAVMDRARRDALGAAFPHLAERLEAKGRDIVLWPEWGVTTRVDARTHAERVRRAISCHRTQVALYGDLDRIPDERHRELWGVQPFWLAANLGRARIGRPGSRGIEEDLFAGIG